MTIFSGAMRTLCCVLLTQHTLTGAERGKMFSDPALHHNLMGVLASSQEASTWVYKKKTAYDPDGGYWDFETNEWVTYDDMGE